MLRDHPRAGKTSGLLPMTKKSTPLDGRDKNTSTKKKRFKGMATRTNIAVAAFFFFLGRQTHWYFDNSSAPILTSSTLGSTLDDDITLVVQKTVVDAVDNIIDLDVQDRHADPSSTIAPADQQEEVKMNAAKLREKINYQINNSDSGFKGHEIILFTLLGGLLREENLIPEGTFLDCGAHSGEQGAHFAIVATDRQVICMDPSPGHVEHMKKEYGELPNLRIEQGGMSDEVGVMKPRDQSFNMDLDAEFQLHTLDSMFYDKKEKLGFAHLDVEGFELKVLKGGLKTIRADKPILTTEVRVHEDHNYTTEMLTLLDKEGYDTYIINEVCGYPHMDYRNLINIPRSLSRRMAQSDTFNLLHATESIFRVDAKVIFDMVLPCCAPGGECCPGGDMKEQSCCTEASVKSYYEKNNLTMRPASMFGFKNSKREYDTWQYRLRNRGGIP